MFICTEQTTKESTDWKILYVYFDCRNEKLVAREWLRTVKRNLKCKSRSNHAYDATHWLRPMSVAYLWIAYPWFRFCQIASEWNSKKKVRNRDMIVILLIGQIKHSLDFSHCSELGICTSLRGLCEITEKKGK